MSDIRCVYHRDLEKSYYRYRTSCGHEVVSISRGWIYCPFCGREIVRAI